MPKQQLPLDELIEKLASGRMSRRRALKTLGVAGVSMATVPAFPRWVGAAEEEAIYFTWGGYDIPEMFTPYKAKHGANPQFATYADSEEGLQKMRAGYVVDVVHPCNQGVPRWRQSGLFQPIDTGRLSNWPNVFERLKKLAGAQDADGTQWFSPMEWGNSSITYRTDLVDLPEGGETWGILWDERYKGKIGMIADAGDSWWCAAIYAGVDFANVTEEDIKKVNALLKEQRPLVRLYSSDMTALQQALASGELVAALTWNDAAVALKSEGVPVRFANPKEGTLTWVCGAMLHKDAPHHAKAHDVIDSLISPEVGEYIIDAFGYGHANVESFKRVSQARLDELALPRDPIKLIDNGVYQLPQSQELETRIRNDFEQIKAGFF